MKAISTINKFFFSMSLLMLTFFVAIAQDAPEKVDVNVSTDGGAGAGAWYGQPWVWAIGVALFIVIIVAITRSGSRRDV